MEGRRLVERRGEDGELAGKDGWRGWGDDRRGSEGRRDHW